MKEKVKTIEYPVFVRFVGRMNEKGNQLAIVKIPGIGRLVEVEITKGWKNQMMCTIDGNTYRVVVRKVSHG